MVSVWFCYFTYNRFETLQEILLHLLQKRSVTLKGRHGEIITAYKFILKLFQWYVHVKIRCGTFLNVIQMHRNIFPAYLKSPGAAARTTGADSPLSFVRAIVGGCMLGLGV